MGIQKVEVSVSVDATPATTAETQIPNMIGGKILSAWHTVPELDDPGHTAKVELLDSDDRVQYTKASIAHNATSPHYVSIDEDGGCYPVYPMEVNGSPQLTYKVTLSNAQDAATVVSSVFLIET